MIQLDRSYEEQDEEQPYEEAEETDTDAEAVPIYQSFLGDDTEETKPFLQRLCLRQSGRSAKWKIQKTPLLNIRKKNMS